ncbi:MAG: tryptophan 7-halogenase [Candidatus Nitrotoga sp.]
MAASTPGYTTVHADFVVDASGANAIFARQQGSQKIKTQPLVCLAARFAIKDAKDNCTQLTHLESVEHGWWYGAQLPNNYLLMALFCDARTAKTQQLQQSDRWHELLGKAVNSAKLIESTEPLSDDITICNAPSHCLDRLYGPHWLAVGDAASSFDPIASQGIIKSISNGLAAADVVLGKTDPVHYSQSINAMYQLYLTMRDRYYQQEQRWPDSPFWQKYQSTAH